MIWNKRNRSSRGLFMPLALLVVISLSSCGVYSFSGASIDLGVKTFSVEYFRNVASIVNPTLSQTLTDELTDKLVSQTTLTLVEEDGDMQFSGAITSYQTSPQAITGTQTAAMNRLTITIKVKFVNVVNEKSSYESTFTRYQDYDSSLNLSDIEESLVAEIVAELIDEIYTKAVVNW